MTKETLTGLVLAITLAVGVGAYSYITNDDSLANNPAGISNEEITDNSKVNRTGVVSVLQEIPVTTSNESETDNNGAPQVAGDTDEKTTLTISTPKEWKQITAAEPVKSCDPSLQGAKQTYEIGTKTITIYENSSPAGCDNKTIGDVDVTFVYGENGVINLQKKDTYVQCTKEQNSTCPKGDGKVTVFFTSRTSDNKVNKNPLNYNSYAFSVVDSSIGANFNKQVGELVILIEKISFKYEQN